MIQANKLEYTLFVVLSALRHVISRERLYDPNNTTVIICSIDLERALDMKFLHVTEIRDVVLTQMELLPPVQLLASLPHTPPATPIPTPGQQPAYPVGTAVVSAAVVPQNLSNAGNSANNSRNSQNLSVTNLNLTNSSNSQIIIPTTNQNSGNNGQQPISTGNSSKFDIEGRYWVKPLFLKVLRKVNGVNPTQVVFSYREVTSYLSQYILDNKDKFFDNRNIKIAHVETDPLGIAFNVKVFHRTQVTTLLRNQLIPFSNNTINNTTKVFKPSPDNSTSLVVNRAEIQPSQALTTTLQEINSSSRKRSAAVESSKDESLRRVRRRNSSSSLKKEPESDEETIYSAQGYSTTAMDNADDDIEASDDSDEDPDRSGNINEYDVYEIEYEPEGASSDDEDQFDLNNSRKAKDKKAKKVSISSGESDIDDIVIAIAVKKLNEFDEFSEETSEGDEAESSDENDFTMNDPENQDFWKCLNCKQPNTPYIRYCSACYKERKGWLPDRPKPKKKRVEKSKNEGQNSKTSSCNSINTSSSKGQKSTKGQPVKSSQKMPKYERSLSELTSTSSSQTETEMISSSQDSGFSEGKQPEINSSDEDDQKTEKNLLNQSRKNPASIDFMANPNMLCTLCCAQPKNACLVHGRISHQVCCYGCAKKLFKNHRGCPVCRRKIEKITKNIIA